MDEQTNDTSKLGIAIGVMAALAFVVAAVIYLLNAKADVRSPEGIELAENDKARVMQVYRALEIAANVGENNPDAGIKKALEAMKDIESLDGSEMESGFVFRKESSPLLSAYRLMAILHQETGDCEIAGEHHRELLRLMETDYLLFPMRLVGPMTVMTGDEKYYAGAKKRNNELLLMGLEEVMKNCSADAPEEKTVRDAALDMPAAPAGNQ